MIFQEEKKRINLLQKILSASIILSLISFFIFRIYAIYSAVAIKTWDDVGYRLYALKAASDDLNIPGALQDVIYPNANILDHTRSIGYHSWIVLALKLSLSGDPEKVFQLANLGLLIIQGIVIFYFSYWASQNKNFSGTLTFIYLSSPIVFGLNRWVMTENFVMTALLIFGFIPFWLLDRDFRPFYRREILIGFLTAWILGIFGSLREYAAPSYLLTSLGTMFALALTKRWDALFGFVIAFFLFFIVLLGGWIELTQFAFLRVTQSEYFHPLSQWFPHFIFNVVGIPLTIFIGVIGLLIAYQVRKVLKNNPIKIDKKLSFQYFKDNITPLQILWLINVILLIFYSLSILISESRQARSGILILFPLLNVLLISLKMFPSTNPILRSTLSNFFSLLLIACTWMTSYYQLFVAFDGGKSFAHHAYDLEYYNHPLYLRPLLSPDDRHTK